MLRKQRPVNPNFDTSQLVMSQVLQRAESLKSSQAFEPHGEHRMNVPTKDRLETEKVAEAYKRKKGNIRATAKELGISRSSVRRKLEGTGLMKKPLVGGTKLGVTAETREHAEPGTIKRYILTSAQNNTHVHEELLLNLEALAEYYKAEIIVGTYTYNQNQYG